MVHGLFTPTKNPLRNTKRPELLLSSRLRHLRLRPDLAPVLSRPSWLPGFSGPDPSATLDKSRVGIQLCRDYSTHVGRGSSTPRQKLLAEGIAEPLLVAGKRPAPLQHEAPVMVCRHEEPQDVYGCRSVEGGLERALGHQVSDEHASGH